MVEVFGEIGRHARSAIGVAELYRDIPVEIEALSRQFNRMARDLAELEHDRTLALAGISHDIRSPLTRLRMEVELAPIDATQRTLMVEDISRINAIVGQFIDYARSNQPPRASRIDATQCVAALVEPDIVTTKRCHVAVETMGPLTVGRTVVDTHQRSRMQPNADVALDANADRFVAMMMEVFRG